MIYIYIRDILPQSQFAFDRTISVLRFSKLVSGAVGVVGLVRAFSLGFIDTLLTALVSHGEQSSPR
jgi:hypothetical protein